MELVDIEGEDYTELQREEFIAEKIEEGYEVLYPAPNQLFIDIDSADAWERHELAWRIFCRDIDDATRIDYPSQSGLPHRHVIVTLPGRELDEQTRVLFQAILGSDPAREALNWRRIVAGIKPVSIFLEKR